MIVSGLDHGAIVSFIPSKYDDLKAHRKVREKLWMECHRAYHCEFDDIWLHRAKLERRSARFLGESFAAVESLHSQYMSLLLPNQNWHSAEPVARGKLKFDDTAADQIDALLDQQLYHGKFTAPMSNLLRQIQIFGNAPYRVKWNQREVADYPAYQQAMLAWELDHQGKWLQYQKALEEWQAAVVEAEQRGELPPEPPQQEMPEPPRAGSTKVVDRFPVLEVGDIFNFVMDPFPVDAKDPLLINHTWTTLAALKKLSEPNKIGFRVYENLEDLTEVDRRDGSDQYLEERFETLGLLVPDNKAVELHEMMGTFEIPGARGDDNLFMGYHMTVANRKTLIMAQPTFLWSGQSPWRLGKYREPQGREIYSVGQLEKALGEQDLINARANQNIDVVNHAIDPEYKAYDDEVIDLELKSAPGRVRLVGDIENLVELRKNLNGLGISFQDLEMLKNDFQRLTLSTAPLAGQSGESATKTALDSNAVSAEVNKIAMYLEEHTLEPILDLFMQYNAQFLDDKQTVKVLQDGKKAFVRLSPEVIREGWAIRVHGARHLVDTQERVQNILMFMQLISGNPLLLPAVDIIELAKMVFKELGFSNIDQIFNDEARAAEILGDMIANGMVGNGGQSGAAGGGGAGPAGNQAQPGVSGSGGQDPATLVREAAANLAGGSAVGPQGGR